MKTFLLNLLFLGLSPLLFAQVPYLSLSAKTEQAVGTATVTLEYTRPTARGREIFGGLVPYDKPWQTGAGLAIISFDEDVRFGDDEVPAGRYALVTVPGKQEWTVMLNPSTDYAPAMFTNRANDAARVRVPVRKPGRFYEALSLELDVTQNDARLYLSWTDVQISIPIKTAAKERVIAYADSLLAAPLATDSYVYVRTADYFLFDRTEGKRAVALTEKLLQLENRTFALRMLRDAHLLTGDKAAALAASDRAIKQAKIEFANDPQTLAELTADLEKKRAEIAGKNR